MRSALNTDFLGRQRWSIIGCVFLFGLVPAACGSGVVESAPVDGGADASSVDSGVPYKFVTIIDVERKVITSFSCGGSNGPGSDIDAVALIRGGKTIGYGSLDCPAYFTPSQTGDECTKGSCSGGSCRYATVEGTFTQTELIARTMGPPNAVVSKSSTDDTGYLSLNGGTLQMQVGDSNGKGSAQTIKSGDQIKVFEVDQSQKTDANGCVCTPEHYQVFIQDSAGRADLRLRAIQFTPINADTCGSEPGPSETTGCGTTLFEVP
jgi:hypothetical protein